MWKTLDFNPLYEANENGEIRKIENHFYPKYRTDKDGYKKVSLTDGHGNKKSYYVHRVIALTFISNPLNKPEVNHINSIRDDNRADNLEWCTRSENMLHAYRDGRWQENRNKARECLFKYCIPENGTKVAQYDLEGEFIASFPSMASASRETGINLRNISLAVRGERNTAGGFIWKKLESSTTIREE